MGLCCAGVLAAHRERMVLFFLINKLEQAVLTISNIVLVVEIIFLLYFVINLQFVSPR